MKYVKVVLFFSLSGLLLFGYTNCSSPEHMAGDAPTSSTLASATTSPGTTPATTPAPPPGTPIVMQGSDACETDLMNLFANGYYQFTRTHCIDCHASGPGKGFFANPNPLVAYNDFMSIGYSLVSQHATDASHQPPYTGPQNIDLINPLKTDWQTGLAQFAKCRGQSPATSQDPSQLIKYETVQKASGYSSSASSPVTLSWMLDSDLKPVGTGTAAVTTGGATFTLDISGGVTAGGEQYYMFSKPRLFGASVDLHVKAMYVKVNGQLITYQTTFVFMDSSVYAKTPQTGASLLSIGTLVVPGVLSAQDQISVAFQLVEKVTLPAPPPPISAQFDGAAIRNVASGSTTLSVDVVLSSADTNPNIVSVDVMDDSSDCFKDVTLTNISTDLKTIGAAGCFPDVAAFVCPGGVASCDPNLIKLGRARSTDGPMYNRFDWDHKFSAQTLLFAPGELRKTVSFTISTDIRKENNRLLSLAIRGIQGAAQIGSVGTVHYIFNKLANPSPTLNVPTYTDLMRPGSGILAQNCMPCHNSVTLAGGYDISNYSLMVSNHVLIPGNPTTSKMFYRLNPNDPAAVGLQPMPLSGFMDPALVQQVKLWIQDGAKNN